MPKSQYLLETETISTMKLKVICNDFFFHKTHLFYQKAHPLFQKTSDTIQLLNNNGSCAFSPRDDSYTKRTVGGGGGYSSYLLGV